MSTQGAVRLLCVMPAAASSLAVSMLSAGAPAEAVSDHLPDLGIARLGDLQMQTTEDGKRLLLFGPPAIRDAVPTACHWHRRSRWRSRDWGDIYTWKAVGRYLDDTKLRARRYRPKARANPGGWFKERKEKNGFAWVDIRLRADRVKVVERGPAARRIQTEEVSPVAAPVIELKRGSG